MKSSGLLPRILKNIHLIALLAISNNSFSVPEEHLSTDAAAAKHAVYQFDTLGKLEARVNLLRGVGMKITDMKVYENTSGQIQYIGLWEPGGDSYIDVYHSMGEFESHVPWPQANGYQVSDIEPFVIDGQLNIYVVYVYGAPTFVGAWSESYSPFYSRYLNRNANNHKFMDVDLYQDNGALAYLSTYQQGSGNNNTYSYHSSFSSLESTFNSRLASNQALVDVEYTLTSNGAQNYRATYGPGNGIGKLETYGSWSEFKSHWAILADDGYSLLDLDVGPANTSNSVQKFVASYGAAPSIPSTNVDLTVMAESIDTAMTSTFNVFNYSYALSQNGQVAIAGAGGVSRSQADLGWDMPMTSETRTSIASVTKLLTAPLLYRLLDRNGLTLSSPVAPYLPAGWSGPGFGSGTAVTFGNLLRHQTRFTTGDTDWIGLQTAIGGGATVQSSGSYNNINYALLRVIIPVLWGQPGLSGPTGAVTQANATTRYLDYMSQTIASNEDINSLDCSRTGSYWYANMYDTAFMSDANVNNNLGHQAVPALDDCGGHASLFLNAQELNRYWNSVRFNDLVMSPSNRALLRGGAGAWYKRNGTPNAYGHGGDWGLYWWTGDSPSQLVGGESHTCLLELPENVVASINISSSVLNSSGTKLSSTTLCNTLRTSYTAARP